jgi:Ser/Thr protein kinase RdoA (MazF antagonist)
VDEIPPEIAAAFYGGEQLSARRLGDGNVNLTLLVDSAGGRQTVLQRLSTIFDERVVEDFAAVTSHLAAAGWEVPQLVPAADGHLWQADNTGRLWRVISFIPSDVASSETADPGLIGGLLGKLHRDLGSLAYQPKFMIPHFHDTAYFAARLAAIRAQLKTAAHQELADRFLEAFQGLELPRALEPQLLHGDPKIANILFRRGEPFTYIDFDTVLRGQIWLDMGDLLRSIAGDWLKAGQPVSRAHLQAVAAGYRQLNYPQAEAAEFFHSALGALQQLALELGLRYLIDIVEDYYFVWNKGTFPDRAAHNYAKADGLWQVYQSGRSLQASAG